MFASGFSHESTTPRSKRLTTGGQYGASSGTYTLSLGKALIGWVAGLVRGRLLISVNNFQGAQLALELLALGHHDEHICLSPLAK